MIFLDQLSVDSTHISMDQLACEFQKLGIAITLELSQCPISEIHMPVDPLKYGYYQPIVDLKKSRKAAIEAFGNLRKD